MAHQVEVEASRQNLSNVLPSVPSYAKVSIWVNLFFRRGTLAVAEAMGVLFMLKALGSIPFALGPAILGTLLLVLGVVVEYLMWNRASLLARRRMDQLEAAKKEQTTP